MLDYLLAMRADCASHESPAAVFQLHGIKFPVPRPQAAAANLMHKQSIRCKTLGEAYNRSRVAEVLSAGSTTTEINLCGGTGMPCTQLPWMTT